MPSTDRTTCLLPFLSVLYAVARFFFYFFFFLLGIYNMNIKSLTSYVYTFIGKLKFILIESTYGTVQICRIYVRQFCPNIYEGGSITAFLLRITARSFFYCHFLCFKFN